MPSIYRDGFEFTSDRFMTVLGRTDRVEPQELRDMFLPKLTPEANKRLRDNCNFVRTQLQHYGIDYSEENLTGNGTNFLKKMLASGKMDKVPDHIEQLRSQMSAEWYDQLTMKEMVDSHQEWLIQKYFLDASGHPDRTKTTGVLEVPLPPFSTYRVSKVTDAVEKVSGLYFSDQSGSMYIGWDKVAVETTASGHNERVKRQMEKEKQDRDQERSSMHSDYLRKARAKQGAKGNWSPTGNYIVDCEAIKNEWPDSADNMTLEICETDDHGIFSAGFDFGILEGVMILSGNKTALRQYCDQLERESPSEEEESDIGSKRKTTTRQSQSSKKQKIQDKAPSKLFLRWKGAETGEGEILYEAEDGSITFKDAELSICQGKMNMAFVGRDVPFTAWKVSESTGRGYGSWDDYSEDAHESASRSRWG